MKQSRPQIGAAGILRLLIAFGIVVANIALFTMLPIASLNLLPMVIAAITLVSSTLDDLGMN